MGIILGAKTLPLNKVHDRNGALLDMISSTNELYSGFGEVFFMYAKPDRARAWDRFDANLCMCVPSGTALIVLYDARLDCPTHGETQTFMLGLAAPYSLLRIPAGVWIGFKSVTESRGVLAAILSDKRLEEIGHETIRFDSLVGIDQNPVYDWRRT